MGKKSRRKRDKRKNPVLQGSTTPLSATVTTLPEKTLLGQRLAGGGATRVSTGKAATELDYAYVRTDMKRTLWLIAGMVVVLVAVVVVDSQSGFFTRLGTQLAESLKLI